LIDFANALEHSHSLHDLINLWIGLQNMMVPPAFRQALWQGVRAGFGPERFAEPVLRFFFEFHRRRWLMLNLRTRDPRRWLRAIRGVRTFARPFDRVGRVLGL
jgi:hypothetical protein